MCILVSGSIFFLHIRQIIIKKCVNPNKIFSFKKFQSIDGFLWNKPIEFWVSKELTCVLIRWPCVFNAHRT